MPRTGPDGSDNLTERQKAWFTSVRDGLERETGRSLDQWVDIARTCPETKHRARLKWFKDAHGLGQNRASYVLNEAFPSVEPGWDEPAMLRAALWTDPESTAIFDAVEAAIAALEPVVPTQRKGYSAFSNTVQFAAIKPYKGGKAVLGLAIAPETDPRLSPCSKESWSERLKARLVLNTPTEVDEGLKALLKAAWARS